MCLVQSLLCVPNYNKWICDFEETELSYVKLKYWRQIQWIEHWLQIELLMFRDDWLMEANLFQSCEQFRFEPRKFDWSWKHPTWSRHACHPIVIQSSVSALQTTMTDSETPPIRWSEIAQSIVHYLPLIGTRASPGIKCFSMEIFVQHADGFISAPSRFCSVANDLH